jgi:polysaccharide biosynthesis/export protein
MINAFFNANMHSPIKYFWVIIFMIFLNSCKTFQPPTYFQNAPRDTTIKKFINKDYELKIQKNDLLSIGIASISTESALPFNNVTSSGYLVDNDGNIEILKIGKVHAEGLTKKELKEKIEKELVSYLKEPLITVKFSNHRVSLLGEVGHPGVYPMPDYPIDLMEIISMAGEINGSGRRDNVLIISDSDSSKQFRRVNLNNTSIFNSKNYYLKPGDVVYVEPRKVKVVISSQTSQLISLVITGISFILVLLKSF